MNARTEEAMAQRAQTPVPEIRAGPGLTEKLKYRLSGKRLEGRYEPAPGQFAAFIEQQADVSIDRGGIYSKQYIAEKRPLSEYTGWDEEPDNEDIARYVLQTFEEENVDNYFLDIVDEGKETGFYARIQYWLTEPDGMYNRGEAHITGTVETDLDFERYAPTVGTGTYDLPVEAASTLIENTDEVDADIPMYVCDPALAKTGKHLKPTQGKGPAFQGEEAANIFRWIAGNHDVTDLTLSMQGNGRDYELGFEVTVDEDYSAPLTASITYSGTLPLLEKTEAETLEQLGCTERT